MPGLMAPQTLASPVSTARVFGLRPVPESKPAQSVATAAAASQQQGPAGVAGAFGSRALLGGLSTAIALRAVSRRRSRGQWVTRRADSISMCKTPKETYEALVEKGYANGNMSFLKTMHASIFGGFYVGMAGLLSLAIAGNLGPDVSMSAQRFTFAALFPVNLLLVLQSGAQLFTGNTATMTCAFLEGKINIRKLLRSWTLSWIGNVIGCGIMALMANYTHLLTAGTADLAIATVLKKCGAGFGPTVVKAIMCNWLVCMAVFLCTQANDLTGKMVGIWFPISMFVAIGFEHSVANMFLLPSGLMSGAPLTVLDVLTKNLLPVSLGNAIAGCIVIGCGFSFSQGALGKVDGFKGLLKLLFGKKEQEEEKELVAA